MAATKFTVVLDIPLTTSQKSALNKNIQALVRKQIASIDNKGVTGSITGIRAIPREWLGIYLKRFGNLEALKNAKNYKVIK